MEYIVKDIPLWRVTIWDKKFNNVSKEWQSMTIKYNYLLSDKLDSIRRDDGNVRILYTGKDIGYTTEELAGENLSEGEVVTIPWGGIPSVKYFNGKFVTGDNRIATSFDTSELSNKYLYYYMRANLHIISSFYRGASLKHPCMKDILKMTISYPKIEIQNKICDELDEIERVIQRNKELLILLDELVKARFVEMFGDPIVNDKFLPMRNLSSLSILKAGKAIKTGELVDEQTNYLYPCYGGNGIRGYINRYSNEGELPIIGRQGAWAGNVNFASGKFYATEHAIVATPIIDLNTVWYYYALKLLDLTRFQTGAAQPGLAVDKLKRIDMPFPPIELQNQFADFVRETDKSRLVYYPPITKLSYIFIHC